MNIGKIENKKYIYGIYSEEEKFINGIKEVKANNFEVTDAYSPYPIHGIDDILELKETNLHSAGFILGLTGTILSFSFITWVSVFNYPTIFAGKPLFALPAFIPIIFELTVLMAAVGMFFVYIKRNELYPGKIPMMVDERTTDDKYAISIGVDTMSEENIQKVKEILLQSSADEVNIKTFEN